MAEILIHDEVQLIDWGESRSGGPWIKLRLPDPEHLEVFRGMDTATAKKSGHILNITIAIGDIIPEKKNQGDYGEAARRLKLSGFFCNPKIWPLIGTDKEFREWVQRQPSCISSLTDWAQDLGEGRCEAAHVRRSAESGTSTKADYACVPLTRKEHQLQHDAGEAALLSKAYDTEFSEEDARKWFDDRRLEYLERWAWQALKESLGYSSWRNVPPQVFCDWAIENDAFKWLPQCYRGAYSSEAPESR